MIGQNISHYKIIEKLGGGGMGIVYKAQDLKLDLYVSLKFLPPSFSLDDESKKRFIHEAKSASTLQHHNICTIHEIDEVDSQLFICMDFYDGETLRDKIKNELLSVEETITITIQIAEGLSKAHDTNIVHRDIKPANIFISNDGIVKILDFGLAKTIGQTKISKPGSLVWQRQLVKLK
jgi:serine/threonine protein kinase